MVAWSFREDAPMYLDVVHECQCFDCVRPVTCLVGRRTRAARVQQTRRRAGCGEGRIADGRRRGTSRRYLYVSIAETGEERDAYREQLRIYAHAAGHGSKVVYASRMYAADKARAKRALHTTSRRHAHGRLRAASTAGADMAVLQGVGSPGDMLSSTTMHDR